MSIEKDGELAWSSDEIMTITASKMLKDNDTCFVGIGIPSTAAILAKSTHAPNLFLIYESGTVNTNPQKLPLSIGDGELANQALTVVGMPEIFNYWLQSGRIDIGFLGAAQIDRFANINTTFIGNSYQHPSFVNQVDFVTSMGFGTGVESRKKYGLRGGGPSKVITDLGILEPNPLTLELTMTHLYPGVSKEQVIENTGWDLKFSDAIKITEKPQPIELIKIRKLINTSDR